MVCIGGRAAEFATAMCCCVVSCSRQLSGVHGQTEGCDFLISQVHFSDECIFHRQLCLLLAFALFLLRKLKPSLALPLNLTNLAYSGSSRGCRGTHVHRVVGSSGCLKRPLGTTCRFARTSRLGSERRQSNCCRTTLTEDYRECVEGIFHQNMHPGTTSQCGVCRSFSSRCVKSALELSGLSLSRNAANIP